MSSPEMQERVYNTRIKNKTFNTSKDEEYLFNILIEKFLNTEITIKRNYKTTLYPYRCDFVIIPFEQSQESDYIYIEYQGHQSHYKYPYTGSESDINIINIWKHKIELSNNPKSQYKKYIQVWSIKDPNKRITARKNKLNWFEFFTVNDMLQWLETFNINDYITNK